MSRASKEFSFSDLSRIVDEFKIDEVEIDKTNRSVRLDNRTDLFRFLVGVGMAEFVKKRDKLVLDEQGAPSIKPLFDEGAVRIIDSSGYGVPYFTHPVRFSLGCQDRWEVLANHSVPLPKALSR